MSLAEQIAERLLAIGAVKLQPYEPFVWASGWQSPIYCDNRCVLSHPEVRNTVLNGLVTQAAAFAPLDGVAGVATAGIAHGALLADRLGLPLIYIRSKAKEHGRQNLVEGELLPGGRYLIVEDLISTGGSVLQAAQGLEAAGGKVAGVLAIFTYEFPQADAAFAAAGYPYRTLSNYSTLLSIALQQQQLAAELLTTLQEWRQDPAAWRGPSS